MLSVSGFVEAGSIISEGVRIGSWLRDRSGRNCNQYGTRKPTLGAL